MVAPTTLTDDRLALRPYQPEDADALYAAVRESLATLKPWMNWAHDGWALSDAAAYVGRQADLWRRDAVYAFAITEAANGAFLGGCSLNRIDRDYELANLGYWVRASRHGQGVATDAARLLAAFGLGPLGLQRVEIVVAVDNVASQRVAVRAGARREGVLRARLRIRGRPVDAVMYSLVAGDFAI